MYGIEQISYYGKIAKVIQCFYNFKVSFITYDRSVHFYSLPEGASQPTQLTVCDVDDVFLPSPSDILVNLQENNGLVRQLLEALPEMFANSYSTESALGAALQVNLPILYQSICTNFYWIIFKYFLES